MCTLKGELYCAFGVMGAFMQPQGHVQVLLNMLEFGMNPQEALDAPRICVSHLEPDLIMLEHGIPESVAQELISQKNHGIKYVNNWDRLVFGKGQIIRRMPAPNNSVLQGGCDPRSDGAAMPVI